MSAKTFPSSEYIEESSEGEEGREASQTGEESRNAAVQEAGAKSGAPAKTILDHLNDESSSDSSEEEADTIQKKTITKSITTQKSAPTKQPAPSHPEPVTATTRTAAIPAGYKLSSRDASTSDDSIFSGKSLTDDLQCWQITATADIPIDLIKSLSLQQLQKPRSILQHEGVSYDLEIENLSLQPELLIRKSGRATYEPFPPGVCRTIRIRRRTVPSAGTASMPSQEQPDFARFEYRKTKAVRQQPGKLLLRYVPFGISSGLQTEEPKTVQATEDNASEIENSESQLSRSPSKKRKHNTLKEVSAGSDLKAEKKRKKKKADGSQVDQAQEVLPASQQTRETQIQAEETQYSPEISAGGQASLETPPESRWESDMPATKKKKKKKERSSTDEKLLKKSKKGKKKKAESQEGLSTSGATEGLG